MKPGIRKRNTVIVIHTDGSCRRVGSETHGGWAAIISHQGVRTEMSGHCSPTTNNRMEMMGALMALQTLPEGSDVYLFTDSKYLQKGMLMWVGNWSHQGWLTAEGKEVLNRDLWEALMVQASRHVVSWVWVKGHKDNELNNRCDKLAGDAARSKVQSVATTKQARNSNQTESVVLTNAMESGNIDLTT